MAEDCGCGQRGDKESTRRQRPTTVGDSPTLEKNETERGLAAGEATGVEEGRRQLVGSLTGTDEQAGSGWRGGGGILFHMDEDG
jgi:hypothetical protein